MQKITENTSRDYSFTYELMDMLSSTEEWNNICNNNPDILKAEAQLEEFINEMFPTVPPKTKDKLWEFIYMLESVFSDVATLYGFHISRAIENVSSNLDTCSLRPSVLEGVRS